MINRIADLRDLRVTTCDPRLITKALKAVLASDGAISNQSTVATEHAVLMVIAAAGTCLMTSKAIGPVNGSTVASLRSEADDRVSRELDRANLKRPGRGVPPPRSGPRPFVVMRVTDKSHAFSDHRLAGMVSQPSVRVSENCRPPWGPP
jgi:hypothetical protein